jgi:bifunctional non-homologous end joining protein LigD
VGTGFNDRVLKQLRSKLLRLQQDRSPFHARIAGTRRGVTWVRPDLVAEVAFSEWTGDGLLRHPSFQGLREDKLPREVKRERPRPTQEVDGQKSDQMYHAPSNPPVKSAGRSNIHTGLDIAGVRLTHPGRILYPEQGLTKRDLAAYYETIAEWILPHVAGRPVMIVRCPEGQGKACFYQKHANETVPAAVKSVRIKEESGKPAPYLMIDDLQGLISLVQMGVLELHVWGARADHIETPDRMVFDLDPDEGLPWTRVVEAAKLVKRRLAALGLKSWVKTTGGKGLHVVVPLSEKQGWDDVKAFSQAVADSFVKEAPEQYTSKMSKMGRKGKIFIDYLRNSRGATAVAAYSTRARAGATVSVPIGWEELERDDLRAFTVKTLPERLASLKADPWKEFWEIRQSIMAKARRDLGLK